MTAPHKSGMQPFPPSGRSPHNGVFLACSSVESAGLPTSDGIVSVPDAFAMAMVQDYRTCRRWSR